MRCSQDHKARTRLRVLKSAARLFTVKGYAATSIDEIMQQCGLTRGGFYAYFSSKAQLYREAIDYAASLLHEPASPQAADDWIDSMCDEYLAVESRLAFLATDVANREAQVRSAYTDAFKSMIATIRRRTRAHLPCDETAPLSLAAMIVGTAAIAHTTDDAALRTKLLAACRRHAKKLLEDNERHQRPTFFWAAGAES